MDYPNINLDVYYILSEYGMHIFICAIVGLGSLIYCLSIRTPKSVFESPKLSKKKYKKEKPSRSKITTKSIPPKIEIKENTSVSTEYATEILDADVDVHEDDHNNSSWQSVVKPKRQSKGDKFAPKPNIKEPSQNNNDCDKPKSISLTTSKAHKQAPKLETESISNQTVMANICDKTKLEPSATVKSPETVPAPLVSVRPREISLDAPQLAQQITVDEPARNESESPTNSLSDDFELVDVYKTSSDDGLPVESKSLISATSGASRKKNKKQQKLISKQLIEAAAIEADSKSGGSLVDKLKSGSAASAASVVKKKRPRKDI